MNESLSRETVEQIDAMVERVAGNAGLPGQGSTNRFKLLEQEYKQRYLKLRGMNEFIEEIKTYLKDGMLDLMEEGYSQEKAVKISLDKFDERELEQTFAEYSDSLKEDVPKESSCSSARRDDASEQLIAVFSVLGIALGLIVGWLSKQIWIGLAIGMFTGVGIGLLIDTLYKIKS